MPDTATDLNVLDLLTPGARIVVRDQEWQVDHVERQGFGIRAVVRCTGRSELVRGRRASFFSDIDRIEAEDPAATRFRLDTSTRGMETRLAIESMMRRTALPVSDTDVVVGHRMLADDLAFQREPFRKAMDQLQPRLLIADAVGLGKTLEVGIMLSELQRRGRANRVLAVVPRHILDQVQHELWSRFGFPLVRLDSNGIQRLRQRIPSGRNPFAYYDRAIVSIDTLKQPGRYRHHLEQVRWDVVWIDESHKLVNKGTYNNQLAQVLAPNADALILSSATPHNGKTESFAELVGLLDPTAVPDPKTVTADDIEHLVVRRHKHSPDVAEAIGDRWAERREPRIVPVTPSPEEERIFTLLSRDWLASTRTGDGSANEKRDTLFPYVLLKAALSSPTALHETVARRLGRERIEALAQGARAEEGTEEARLWSLHQAAKEALAAGSAKLDALVANLEEIGVGPSSDVRVVVFSERIATLDWIAETVRTRLGMNEEQVETFHNSKSDEEQQRIVESFAMASAPVRVLVTSDIASEGVNLHKQCHHLIHADLPWSLITTTQRNGRIDRYGQVHPPDIRYLVYAPAGDRDVASDVRILTKLVAKEHEAHRALGDAASVMGLHSETAEEREIVQALRERNEAAKEATLEAVAPSKASWDPWAFVGLAGSSRDDAPHVPDEGSRPRVVTRDLPSLFEDDVAYLLDGLRLAYDGGHALDLTVDEQVVSFTPPEDLLARLQALPQAYLKQRNVARRLLLTGDFRTAERSLRAALDSVGETGEAGTAWPEVHFLGPTHPVLDWLADKVLFRLGRNEAFALPADVDEPTILVSGVWANKLGEPIAASWLAATVEDGLVTFSDMTDTLRAAGLTSDLVNRAWQGDLASVEAHLPTVVRASRERLKDDLATRAAQVADDLAATKRRVERWRTEARTRAEAMPPGARRKARLKEIERVTTQYEALIAEQRPADAPLVRIVGALLPGSRR